MAKPRRIYDESDARRCLRAAASAGEAPRDWARAHGVDARSLNLWRINLDRRGSGGAPRAKVVELVAAAGTARDDRGGSRYTVEVGGLRLEFGDDAKDATLRMIIEVLRSC